MAGSSGQAPRAALSPFGLHARSAISAILRNVNTRRRFASGSFAISASVSATVVPYAWYVGISESDGEGIARLRAKAASIAGPNSASFRASRSVSFSRNSGIPESAQRLAQFRGRADASGAPAEHLSAELITHRQIAVPDVGATRRVLAEDIMMGQCKLKKAETIRASTPSLFRVGVARKAGDHGDVRVDGVTDRHAFTSECFIVLRYPVTSLRGINEGKGERADP